MAVGGLWKLWVGLVGYALLGVDCCVMGFVGGCVVWLGVWFGCLRLFGWCALRVFALGCLVVGGCASAPGFLVYLAVCASCGVGII